MWDDHLVGLADLSQMLGKTLLVGITYLDSEQRVTRKVQFAGTVVEVEPLVTIDRGESGLFTLPPGEDAYFVARSGEYRLRETGEVIVNPGFVTTWAVHEPSA
jgi:hypothetical protein